MSNFLADQKFLGAPQALTSLIIARKDDSSGNTTVVVVHRFGLWVILGDGKGSRDKGNKLNAAAVQVKSCSQSEGRKQIIKDM